MTKFAVDDDTAIATRLKEIQRERAEALAQSSLFCSCGHVGVQVGHAGAKVCSACQKPKEL